MMELGIIVTLPSLGDPLMSEAISANAILVTVNGYKY